MSFPISASTTAISSCTTCDQTPFWVKDANQSVQLKLDIVPTALPSPSKEKFSATDNNGHKRKRSDCDDADGAESYSLSKRRKSLIDERFIPNPQSQPRTELRTFKHRKTSTPKSPHKSSITLSPPQNSTIVFSPMSATWIARKQRAMDIGHTFRTHNAQLDKRHTTFALPHRARKNRSTVFYSMSPAWWARKKRAVEIGRTLRKHNTRISRHSGERYTTPPSNSSIVFGEMSPAWIERKQRAVEIGTALHKHSAQTFCCSGGQHDILSPSQNSSVVFDDMSPAWWQRKQRAVEIGRAFLAHST